MIRALRSSLHPSSYGPAVYINIKNRLVNIGSTSGYSSSKLQCTSNDAVDINTLDKEMSVFFDACRRPILSKNVTSIGEFTRDEECITKVVYGVGEDSIEAYVLPKSVRKWPSYYDKKQLKAQSCEVLCIRTDRMNNVRRKMIVDYTLLGKQSITMGPSGIGKSSESNYMMLEFLRNIGRDGYPRNVLYRIPGECVFVFSIDAENKLVAKKIPNSETLREACDVTNQYNRKNSVILLETSEFDIDPASNIPCIVTASSRDIDNTFKTLIKGGAVQFLCEPPSRQQLVEQVKAMKLLSEDCGEFAPLSLEQCIETVEARVSIVGPITRYVLSSTSFLSRKYKTSTSGTPFFNVLTEVTADNIAGNAKYYIAPFFKAGAATPLYAALMPDSSSTYTFEFLSRYCENAIAACVGGAKFADLLKYF